MPFYSNLLTGARAMLTGAVSMLTDARAMLTGAGQLIKLVRPHSEPFVRHACLILGDFARPESVGPMPDSSER